MRGRRWIWVTVLLALLGVLIWWWFGATASMRMGEPNYVSSLVERRDLRQTITGNGALEPQEIRQVLSMIAGEVVRSPFPQEGQVVNEGEVLLRLDNDELRHQMERSRLDVQLAELSLKELLGLPADAPLPSVVAVGGQVMSPREGRVDKIHGQLGDRVTRDARLIELVHDREAWITLEVAPAELLALNLGDPVRVVFSDFSGEYVGRIRELPADDDPMSGFRSISIVVDNPAGLIETGMDATVTLSDASPALARRGSVDQPQRTMIHAPAAGLIDAIWVREGDWVRLGERLIDIGAASQSIQIDQQHLRLRQAQMALERLRQQWEEREVISPIDGEILEVLVAKGQTVSAGVPLLTVAGGNSLEVIIRVDELEITHLRKGQPAEVMVEALQARVLQGHIVFISRRAERSGDMASYRVEIGVPADPDVLSGMSAEVTVEVDRAEQVLSVPAEAITSSLGQHSVRVITPEGLQTRTVEIGVSDGAYIEIRSGLEEGEEVVLAMVSQPMFPFMPGRG